jgi:hypothetical protein
MDAVLEPAAEAEVGADRLPNLSFASDHLSLVADFKLLNNGSSSSSQADISFD